MIPILLSVLAAIGREVKYKIYLVLGTGFWFSIVLALAILLLLGNRDCKQYGMIPNDYKFFGKP